MPGPLEGLLVVALEQAVAAPFCTMRLADAGARVFIQNLKPGAIDRIGYPVDQLCASNPRLIACSISGYGETGPMAARKAYDLLVQAESGLASITGGPSEASRVGFSIVDIATGAVAAQSIMEALYGRSSSGRGTHIKLSMFDTIVEWMAVPFLHAAYGRPPKRVGLAHPSIAPYGVFSACDGRQILISIQNEREWEQLCTRVLQEPALLRDERFATNVARVEHRAETDGEVAARFGAIESSELVAHLTEADIAFAFVNELEDLLRHSQLQTVSVRTPAGPAELPSPAPRWTTFPRSYGAVPALGEATETVRREFGL